jgi:nucleoid-associated protein YgaU
MAAVLEQQRGKRVAIGGGIALVVAVILGLLWYFSAADKAPPVPGPQAAGAAPPATRGVDVPPAAAPSAAGAPPAAAPAPADAAAPALVPPTFDVARIAADGTAVMAGRAPAQAQVEIRGNGTPVGTSASGADGSWAAVIDKPLPEGTLELSLEAKLPDGRTIRSDQVVLVDVPSRARPSATASAGEGTAPAAAEPPVAVLTDRDQAGTAGPSRILQGPGGAPAPLPTGSAPTLDLVEYGTDGAPILAGRARPGATIRLYLGDRLIAQTTAGPDGQWRVTPDVSVDPGRYALRLDEIGADGKVVARRELPFERATPQAVASAGTVTATTSSFTVQPGNSLWRIARNQFGTGTRYLDLYRANEGQIKDPDLIYPGQVLELPR